MVGLAVKQTLDVLVGSVVDKMDFLRVPRFPPTGLQPLMILLSEAI
jgi:hypothetical protein